jgi:hypothetical protein
MTTYNVVNGTAYNSATISEVIDVLERVRESKRRVRIFFGDTATGESWLEEYGVTGTIGRSTGSMKIPLLINNARSVGGVGLLDHCILRIIDIETKVDLYRHNNFHVPELTVNRCECKDCKAEVSADGQVVAHFPTFAMAEKWVAFMRGERFSSRR